ncbi:MAG: hypothetical protein ACTH9B_12810, partial [Brevibacterium aurantiacum]
RRVCARCYYAMRSPQPCPECNRKVMLTGLIDGMNVCAECAGTPVTMACPGCGSISEVRKHHLCVECRRPIMIQQLLADETGEIRDELAPLAHYLLTYHDKALSLERWLRNTGSAAPLLRELVTGRLPLEAGAINSRARSPQGAVFILSLLVQSGVLPEMDVPSMRFERWLESWLDGIGEPDDCLVLRQYCAWEVLGANKTSTSRSQYQNARMALNHCARLLLEIRSQEASLMTYPQRMLDAFLTGSPVQRDALAPFTRWLRRQGLSRLRVDFRPRILEGRDYAADHRMQMARKFISDTDMHAATRVAGLLVLFYGLPLTRISSITQSQINADSLPVTLTVGNDPIELPEPLGDAIVRQLGLARRRSDSWLFPGRVPGRPLTAGPLGIRLRKEGLMSGSARTTALIELTRQLHPRVVSDLLGITSARAAVWSRLAGGEWSDYPALRATPTRPQA